MKANIPTDETLMEISHQLDDFLYELCETNDMPFMQIAALVLARLGVIAKDINEEEYLIRLMKLSEVALNAQQNPFDAMASDQIH